MSHASGIHSDGLKHSPYRVLRMRGKTGLLCLPCALGVLLAQVSRDETAPDAVCNVQRAYLPQAFTGNVVSDTGMVAGFMTLTEAVIVAVRLTEEARLQNGVQHNP